MTNSADLPTATNIRNVSEICVTSFNISWDLSYSTCEDVTNELSISPPPVEGNAIAFTYNMFYSITGLNNNLPNVTITVTVGDRGGQGNDSTFYVKLPKPKGMLYSKKLLAVKNFGKLKSIHQSFFAIVYQPMC